jgi:hypothetical protein
MLERVNNVVSVHATNYETTEMSELLLHAMWMRTTTTCHVDESFHTEQIDVKESLPYDSGYTKLTTTKTKSP